MQTYGDICRNKRLEGRRDDANGVLRQVEALDVLPIGDWKQQARADILEEAVHVVLLKYVVSVVVDEAFGS